MPASSSSFFLSRVPSSFQAINFGKPFSAQLPIAKKIKMPPSEDPSGNGSFESENESRENDCQAKMSRRTSKSSTRMTPLGKKMRPKPAYLSSKETVQKKDVLARISDRLDQHVKQYCFEKNTLYNTTMLLCTLLVSVLFSLLCQLLKISSVLRIWLLPSSLLIHVYLLFAHLSEKLVTITGSLKQGICALSASVTGKKERTASGVKS